MTTFDERERSFEAKYAHDLEMNFRAEARRGLWLGLWAGRTMGLDPEALITYAREIVRLDFERAGIAHVVEKVTADMTTAGVTPEMPVEAKAAELLREAKVSVMTDPGPEAG
ncbi:MAG: DUF1476 domain-containing protein [Paracoccaceae bacterium]